MNEAPLPKDLQHGFCFPFPSFVYIINLLFDRYVFVFAKCLELIFCSVGWYNFCFQVFLQIGLVSESLLFFNSFSLVDGCQPVRANIARHKGIIWLVPTSCRMLPPSIFLLYTVVVETTPSLSIMATTVVKEKDVVMFRMENSSNNIGAIFHLQDHVVVICIDTIFEFNNKRWALKWLFLQCTSLLVCC